MHQIKHSSGRKTLRNFLIIRNVIERIFGVVKRHFKVLVVAQEYSLDRQSQLISALSVLHNFILANNPNDTPCHGSDGKVPDLAVMTTRAGSILVMDYS
jgi:hypothetical protein